MNVPLTQAFALYAAIAVRYGSELRGPSYVDRQILRALKEAS